MFISRALVDGFGCLAGQDASGLSPGLNVFLGQNEAGKSTCQKFFQAMLFGYKRGKSSIEPNIEGRAESGTGKRARQNSGGTLFLDFDAHERIILTRRPGAFGGILTLTTEDGASLGENFLGTMLPGITMEVFDRVFAITLRDLMEFSSLSGDAVRHALHGAAFGTGFKSPADILKTLDGRMRDLHSKSPSCALNLLLRRLEDTDAALKRIGPILAQYREAEVRLGQIRESQHDARSLVDSLELERAGLDRRINAWPVFEDLRAVRFELEAVSSPGAGSSASPAFSHEARFTPDGAERLESILAMKSERELALAEAEGAVKRLGDEVSRIPARTRAAHWRLGVQHLLEQKENRRAEAKNIPLLRRDIAQITERQKEIAAGFGPDWGLAEARKVDVSLAARDRVRDAESRLLAATGQVNVGERDAERAAAEAAQARAALDVARGQRPVHNLPAGLVDAALPDDVFIEELGAAQATAADALERLPVLSLKLDEAAKGLERSLADIGPGWNAEVLAEADLSMPGKQRIQYPAHEFIRWCEEEAQAVQRLDFSRERLAEAREAAALAQARLSSYGDLPDELELAGRGNALRRLEKAWMGLEPASAASIYATERAGRALDDFNRPKGKMRLLPPFLFLFLFMAGIGGVIGGLWLDQAAFAPVGGGLAGLGLIFGGVWYYLLKKEDRQKLAEIAELRETEERAKDALSAVTSQIDSILLESSSWLHSFDDGTPPWQAVNESFLDKAQSALEKLRVDLARKRRDEEEAEKAYDALNRAGMDEKKAALAHEAARSNLETAERSWGECLALHRLSPGLSPETTEGLFHQIGIAKLKHDELLDRGRDLDAAVAAIRKCLDKAGTNEFMRLALSSQGASLPGDSQSSLTTELTDSLALVQKAVTLAREAAAFKRELAHWQKNCDERQETLSALEESHAAALIAVGAARDELLSVERDWADWLESQGLPQGLNPGTAAEALRLAEKYISLENERLALEDRARLQASSLEDYIGQIVDLSGDLGFDSAEWGLFLEPVSPSCNQEIAPPQTALDSFQASLPGVPAASATIRSATVNAAASSVRSRKLKGAPEEMTEAALRLLDALAGATQKALEDNALLAEKKEQLASREQDMHRSALAVDQAADDLGQLLRAGCVDDAESFRAAFAAWKRAVALSERERSLSVTLKNAAAEEGIGEEEFSSSLAAASLDSLREKKSAIDAVLAEARERDRHLAEEGGELAAVKNSLRGSDEDAALRSTRAGLEEDLERISREWSVLAVAKQLLLRAKERFENQGQSGVIMHATEIFNAVTDGEYVRVFTRLGQDAIEVRRKNGLTLDPDKHLSQGAKEQLYLALRLAYIRNHAKNAEAAPVFMDDVLVNFDPGRSERTARILAEFALENQVFFFTCHPGIAEMLFEAGLKAAETAKRQNARPGLLRIENGIISPAAV